MGETIFSSNFNASTSLAEKAPHEYSTKRLDSSALEVDEKFVHAQTSRSYLPKDPSGTVDLAPVMIPETKV